MLASVAIPKTTYAVPPAKIAIPAPTAELYLLDRPNFAPDGSLTPQFPVGLGSITWPTGSSDGNLFAAEILGGQRRYVRF